MKANFIPSGSLVLALAASLTGQTWSPFSIGYSPLDQVSASSLGLLSVASDQGAMATREFDGQNWFLRSSPGVPPARGGFAMAYDSARQRVVLFGGFASGTPFADTWEWTGNNWQPRLTFAYPPGRSGGRMAFDSLRGRMVLFGGGSPAGIVNDTWEYDGQNWFSTQPTTQPPPRAQFGLAFHPASQRTVLYGGSSTGSGWDQIGDTWTWDGSNWTQRFPATTPGLRSDHGMSLDPRTGEILVFGGLSHPPNQVYLASPYAWNGTTWNPRNYYVMPTPRIVRVMATDEVHQSVVIMGGYNAVGLNLTDGWITPGSIAALAQTFGSGCGVSLLATQAPILGQTAVVTMSRGTPINLAFIMIGFSRTNLGPFTLPLPLDGYGLPGCYLLHDAAITAFAPCQVAGANQASYSIALPNAPALSGVAMDLQGWVADPTANQAGMVLSNGLGLVFGNY